MVGPARPHVGHGRPSDGSTGAMIPIPALTISRVEISRGPASIESAFDDMLAVPDTVAKIIEAERDGVHAVVIAPVLATQVLLVFEAGSPEPTRPSKNGSFPVWFAGSP